ncbi:UNVERIFIED_CONTAM: hypothetical protein FKN15_056176 [Acipenser sinensis]
MISERSSFVPSGAGHDCTTGSKGSFVKYYSGFGSLGGQACGGLVQGLNGTIESPGFPHGYPNYANCTWIIVTGERNRIQLSFHTFALEDDFDIVAIYDGQPLQGNLKMRAALPRPSLSARPGPGLHPTLT